MRQKNSKYVCGRGSDNYDVALQLARASFNEWFRL